MMGFFTCVFCTTAIILYCFSMSKQVTIVKHAHKKEPDNLAVAFLVHNIAVVVTAVLMILSVMSDRHVFLLTASLTINIPAIISVLTYSGSKFIINKKP